MMEHHASNPYGSPVAIPISEPEVAQSELSSKVRALQNEIESFSAPHADRGEEAEHFAEPTADGRYASLSAKDLAAEQEWHQNNTAAAPVERKPAPKPIASPAPWLDHKPEPEPVANVEEQSVPTQEAELDPALNHASAPVSHETLYEAAIEEVDELAGKDQADLEPIAEPEQQALR